MEKFFISLKFAFNIYIVASFITLLVLGMVKIISRLTRKNS